MMNRTFLTWTPVVALSVFLAVCGNGIAANAAAEQSDRNESIRPLVQVQNSGDADGSGNEAQIRLVTAAVDTLGAYGYRMLSDLPPELLERGVELAWITNEEAVGMFQMIPELLTRESLEDLARQRGNQVCNQEVAVDGYQREMGKYLPTIVIESSCASQKQDGNPFFGVYAYYPWAGRMMVITHAASNYEASHNASMAVHIVLMDILEAE